MNSKMHKKTSNDGKNYESTKIWLFSGGKTEAVKVTTCSDFKKHLIRNLRCFT